jgi:hypothetical protein
MAINFVALVARFLTPEMIGRIATAFGLERNMVQSAASARYQSCWGRLAALPTNLAVRKSLSRRLNRKPGRSADLPTCLALGANPHSSSADRSCSRLCSVLEIKLYLRTHWFMTGVKSATVSICDTFQAAQL